MSEEALPNLFVGMVRTTEPKRECLGEWAGRFVATVSQAKALFDGLLPKRPIAVNVIDMTQNRTVYGMVWLTHMEKVKGLNDYRLFDFLGTGKPYIFEGDGT